MAEVNGAEWAWIAVPLTALGGAALKSLGWLRRMEREAGRASEYERTSRDAVAQLERTIAAKDAEINALRALNAAGRGGQ